MELYDSHCHLDPMRFGDELPDVLARARAAGVTRLTVIGTRALDSEAAADLAHERLGEARLAAGAGLRGRRFSFGFPACPGIEQQTGLLDLLGAGRAGISLSSGFQLIPEFSVTAFVIARPDALYFAPERVRGKRQQL